MKYIGSTNKYSIGFTLIELIVSITLITILTSLAWPNLQGLFTKYQARSAVLSLKRTLTHGRIKAIQLSRHVTICPTENNQCSDDWSLPLSTFTDNNSNQIIDNDDTLYYQTHHPLKNGFWQKKRHKAPYITFNPLGHAFASATTFLYCPKSGSLKNAKQLIINFQGRIRSQNYLSSNGTPYRRVSPLSCSSL